MIYRTGGIRILQIDCTVCIVNINEATVGEED